MEGAIIQTRAQAVQSGVYTVGAMQGRVSMSDPFMAIIQNMIAGMAELGNAQTEGTCEQTEQSGDDGTQDALLQGFAAMMAQSPSAAGLIMQMAQSDGETSAAVVRSMPDLQAAVAYLQGAVQSMPKANTEAEIKNALAAQAESVGTGEEKLYTEVMPQQTGIRQTKQDKSKSEGEIISAQYTPGDGSTDSEGDAITRVFGAQKQYSQATIKAKQQFDRANSQTEKGNETEIDFDKLQAQVDMRRTQPGVGIKQAQPVQEKAQPMLEQLKTGISENLTLGKNEFILKLKPKELGEITVKLTEEAGKLTLNIVTATQQAAKAINQDLGALRDAVRPMQVQVHEAVTQASDSSGAQMQQFDSGRQFEGRQHSFTQGGRQEYYAPQGAAEEEQAQSELVSDGMLNVYI